MRHELKTDPEAFQAVWDGIKLYEIRKDDRTAPLQLLEEEVTTRTPFKANDELLLRETKWAAKLMHSKSPAGAPPMPLAYTGREVLCVVTHKLTGYGLQDGWCILGIRRLELRTAQPFVDTVREPGQPELPKIIEHAKTRDPLYVQQTGTSEAKQFEPETMLTKRPFSHYFRPCPYDGIDVYRVLEIFGVTSPAIQHAIKKLLVPGRRGSKDTRKDLSEAVVSINRAIEMMDEDAAKPA